MARAEIKALFPALALVIFFPWLAACARPPATAAPGGDLNLTRAKQAVAAYHESGDHGRDMAKAADKIKAYVEQRLKRPVAGRPAVVFDLDETLVDNYPALKKDGFRYMGPGSDSWHALLYANPSRPVESMARLYDWLRNHQVALFIVSERPPSMRGITAQALFKDGFEGWTGLYLTRPLPNETEAQAKARVRAMIQNQGFTIIANISDQQADLAQGPADQSFKLPNHLYAYD